MSTYELEAYIGNKRYKDGQSRCTRLLKKSPNDPLLLIYRARFHRGLGQESEANGVLKLLFERNPPIIDPTVIYDIETFVHEGTLDEWPRPLTSGPEINALWNNAINVASNRTKTLDLYRERFANAVNQRRWRDAGTALQNWKKAVPSDRTPRYLHLVILQVLAESEHDPKTAALNRTLAVRTLQQSGVETVNELRAAVVICRRQEEWAKALIELLEKSENDGKETILVCVRNDWEFVRPRIEALLELKDWKTLRELCRSLLVGTESNKEAALRAREDWLCWQCYLEASVAQGEPVNLNEVKDLFPADSQRLQRLAVVHLAHLEFKPQSENAGYESLLEALKTFFDTSKTEISCFNDIRSYVLDLDEEHRMRFLDHVSDMSSHISALAIDETRPADDLWLFASVNSLKFEYLIMTSRNSAPLADNFQSFACKALDLEARSRRNPGKLSPEPIFLAVAALIRLHDLSPDHPYLLIAACLLESQAKTNIYQAKVLLVYIYHTLGLFSKAMHHYENIKVKEIQNESFCHSLMTRISISHPYSTPPRTSTFGDPTDRIKRILTIYENTDNRLADVQADTSNNGRSDMLFELEDLRKTLAHSFTERILILERRRIARLTDAASRGKEDRLHPAVVETWTSDLRDSRDFRTTFHFESSKQPTAESRLQNKRPDAAWLQFTLLMDETYSLLQSPAASLLAMPMESSNKASFPSDPAVTFTSTEAALFRPWTSLHRVVCQITLQTSHDDSLVALMADLIDLLQSMTLTNLITTTQSIPCRMPIAETIQSHFLLSDYLKTVSLLCIVATDINKSRRQGQKTDQGTIDRIRRAAEDLFNRLQEQAKQHRSSIDAKAVERWMIENGGKVTERMLQAFGSGQGARNGEIGEGMVRHLAEEVARSAEDAYDGVLRVRLK